ncbi:unnamed protein product, partial [Amoebophrya sp. A120]|eukprot:GSA120T00001292001.1
MWFIFTFYVMLCSTCRMGKCLFLRRQDLLQNGNAEVTTVYCAGLLSVLNQSCACIFRDGAVGHEIEINNHHEEARQGKKSSSIFKLQRSFYHLEALAVLEKFPAPP